MESASGHYNSVQLWNAFASLDLYGKKDEIYLELCGNVN